MRISVYFQGVERLDEVIKGVRGAVVVGLWYGVLFVVI